MLDSLDVDMCRVGLQFIGPAERSAVPLGSEVERDDLYRTEHQVFLDAAAGLREPSSPASKAIVSMEIADAALRSWRAGRRIEM